MSAVDPRATAEQIDEIFETAASEQIPAIAVFPTIKTESQLVDLLHRLNNSERWSSAPLSVKGLTTDDLLVGLRWKTSAGFVSLPMGFGPFVTMPVTRRPPYVCIATWPDGRANPRKTKPRKDLVDFLDAALPKPLSDEEYQATWDDAVRRTSELLAEQGDSSSYYREVTFRLSAEAAKQFRG